MIPAALQENLQNGSNLRLTDSEPVIVTQNLTRTYRVGSSEVQALRGVKFEHPAGRICGTDGVLGLWKDYPAQPAGLPGQPNQRVLLVRRT